MTSPDGDNRPRIQPQTDGSATPVTGSPEPSLLQRMQRLKPDDNIVCTAVDQLQDPEDMALFLVQYAAFLRAQPDPRVSERPFEAASINIRAISGRTSTEVDRRWTDVVVWGSINTRLEDLEETVNAHPNQSVVGMAVDELADPKDMATFFVQYAFASQGEIGVMHFEETAGVILEAAAKSSESVVQRWRDLLQTPIPAIA